MRALKTNVSLNTEYTYFSIQIRCIKSVLLKLNVKFVHSKTKRKKKCTKQPKGDNRREGQTFSTKPAPRITCLLLRAVGKKRGAERKNLKTNTRLKILTVRSFAAVTLYFGKRKCLGYQFKVFQSQFENTRDTNVLMLSTDQF